MQSMTDESSYMLNGTAKLHTQVLQKILQSYASVLSLLDKQTILYPPTLARRLQVCTVT